MEHFKVLRWDGTTPSVMPPQDGGSDSGGGSDQSCSDPAGTELAEKSSVQTAEVTLHSALSVPSFFASAATEAADDDIKALCGDSHTRPAQTWQNDVAWKEKGQVVLSKADNSRASLLTRPFSAGVLPVRDVSIHAFTLCGEKLLRPQTASASSPTRTSAVSFGPEVSSGASVGGLSANRTEAGTAVSATADTDGCQEAGSSIGGKVSVAVTLPVLVETGGAYDAR